MSIRQTSGSPRKTLGMSLLEVLIAVLILAIGLLGVAALQATALRNAQGSLARSQAVMHTYAMLDSIRAAVPVNAVDNAALKTTAIGDYNLARQCPQMAAGATLAENDQQAWIDTIHRSLGDSACGTITCNATIANECEVVVEWDETRSTGGTENYTITTVSQI